MLKLHFAEKQKRRIDTDRPRDRGTEKQRQRDRQTRQTDRTLTERSVQVPQGQRSPNYLKPIKVPALAA